MLDTRTKKIGEYEYQVRQLTAPIGRKLLVRLFKVLGPSISAGLSSLPDDEGKELSLGDLKANALGDAVAILAETITEGELEHVVETLSEATQYSGEPDRWLPLKRDAEFHWAGRFLQMFQWIAFCLEVNYSDFLGGQVNLSGFGSAKRTEDAQASQSPKA